MSERSVDSQSPRRQTKQCSTPRLKPSLPSLEILSPIWCDNCAPQGSGRRDSEGRSQVGQALHPNSGITLFTRSLSSLREDILEVHVETSWVCDESGGLLTSNEPSPDYRQPAIPHLLTWSADRWHHRFRADIPLSDCQSLTDLTTAHWPFLDRLAPIPIDEIRRILKPHADVTKVISGPTFVIPETQPETSNAVAITPKNAHLCCEMSPSMVDDVIDEQPCFAVFLDGKAVSICTERSEGLHTPPKPALTRTRTIVEKATPSKSPARGPKRPGNRIGFPSTVRPGTTQPPGALPKSSTSSTTPAIFQLQ
jgi:hypothetical protein